MIFNFDDDPGGMSADLLGFTTEGALLFSGSGNEWEAALLASGTLTTERSVLVDLFLVAGGQPGGAGSGDYSFGYGGTGGPGGGRKLVSGVWLRRGVSYAVTIGASGQDTSISGTDLSESAVSGEGSAGGQGAKTGNQSRARSASAGSNGVFAFNEETDPSLIEALAGRKYGPGGGGADTRYTDGNNTTYSNSTSHSGSLSGGQTGGGNGAGGTNGIGSASAGAANTGAGGGAGSKDQNGAVLAAPAAGGSGILLIRPHEEVAA